MDEIEKKNREAWGIAHELESDLIYFLNEARIGGYAIPQHMLNMVFKHISRQLKDIKTLIKSD